MNIKYTEQQLQHFLLTYRVSNIPIKLAKISILGQCRLKLCPVKLIKIASEHTEPQDRIIYDKMLRKQIVASVNPR